METKHITAKDDGVKVVKLSAIAKHIVDNIPDSKEKLGRKKYVEWGEDNKYPFFINDLYENVPTLASIINGCMDYVAGNRIIFNGIPQGDDETEDTIINGRGDTVEDLIREMAKENALYNGFALEIIRTKDLSEISEVCILPLRYLRSDENHEVFYYNEGFGDKWNKKGSVVLPKYLPDKRQGASVLYVKGAGISTYPKPIYQSAIESCAIEMEVNQFHYNSIRNGFMGSYIVGFNTGVPDDEMKAEIEDEFYEKYCGSENAGNVMLLWTRGKEYAPTVIKMDIQDYGEKYETLVKRSSQQIFTSFRANPNLFGIATESNGFNSEEYEYTFKLFNKTTIRPMQKRIISTINRIFGRGSLQIEPFDLEERQDG